MFEIWTGVHNVGRCFLDFKSVASIECMPQLDLILTMGEFAGGIAVIRKGKVSSARPYLEGNQLSIDIIALECFGNQFKLA